MGVAHQVLRLLYIDDLRLLQTHVNEIVAMLQASSLILSSYI